MDLQTYDMKVFLQAHRFHLAPFRNRAKIVPAKVTFSNNFAPA
jgi:hypothetical protein